jgi:hypothetical protein
MTMKGNKIPKHNTFEAFVLAFVPNCFLHLQLFYHLGETYKHDTCRIPMFFFLTNTILLSNFTKLFCNWRMSHENIVVLQALARVS